MRPAARVPSTPASMLLAQRAAGRRHDGCRQSAPRRKHAQRCRRRCSLSTCTACTSWSPAKLPYVEDAVHWQSLCACTVAALHCRRGWRAHACLIRWARSRRRVRRSPVAAHAPASCSFTHPDCGTAQPRRRAASWRCTLPGAVRPPGGPPAGLGGFCDVFLRASGAHVRVQAASLSLPAGAEAAAQNGQRATGRRTSGMDAQMAGCWSPGAFRRRWLQACRCLGRERGGCSASRAPRRRPDVGFAVHGPVRWRGALRAAGTACSAPA